MPSDEARVPGARNAQKITPLGVGGDINMESAKLHGRVLGQLLVAVLCDPLHLEQ